MYANICVYICIHKYAHKLTNTHTHKHTYTSLAGKWQNIVEIKL